MCPYKMLIVTALDFRKAYDSIDRGKLVETLVEFRIHPAIIELVVKVYSGDETMIKMGDKETKIAITSGIKQGCTASTVFFKLITYLIIDKLEREGEMVEVGGVGLNSLWFADDSLIMSNSVEGTRRNIRLVREVSRSFGLEINEDKSAILVFKGDPGVGEIEGIKVVKNFKYLGLNIGDGNDIFEKHKVDTIKKAAGRATGVGMVVEKSCNKLLVGKTWWKNGILPGILLGVGVMRLKEKQIEDLQVIENRVYRMLTGAMRCTPITILRGEVGASAMKSRIIETKLKLVKSMMECENGLVRRVAWEVWGDGNSIWNKQVGKYLREVGIGREEFRDMDKEEIGNRVKAYDNRIWREELNGQSSASLYREHKGRIREETIYDNSIASEVLFRARANRIKLGIFNRHSGGDTTCKICGEGEEDLEHFILKCSKLEGFRRRDLIGEGSGREVLGRILFDKKRIGEVKTMLGKLWRERTYWLRIREIRRIREERGIH